MKRLVILILIFALTPALMGLGTQLWPGGGGSSGPLHPASGTDSQICLGENDDYDGNTVCDNIDAGVNLVADADNWYSKVGILGTEMRQATVNDGAIGLVREFVKWNGAFSGGSATTTASILAVDGPVRSPMGCYTKAVALSIVLGTSNDSASHNCDYQVIWADSAVQTTFDNTTTGAGTGWNLCNEIIEVGSTSDNTTWGYGSAPKLDTPGEYWVVPLTNCTTTAIGAPILVNAAERSAGSCVVASSTQITLYTSQVCE